MEFTPFLVVFRRKQLSNRVFIKISSERLLTVANVVWSDQTGFYLCPFRVTILVDTKHQEIKLDKQNFTFPRNQILWTRGNIQSRKMLEMKFIERNKHPNLVRLKNSKAEIMISKSLNINPNCVLVHLHNLTLMLYLSSLGHIYPPQLCID